MPINAEILRMKFRAISWKSRHEPPDKWVEWETQSVEEVGKEYYPLMGPWGGEKLPLLGKPVRDVFGQYPAFLSFLTWPSMTEETIHLPPTLDIAGEG